MRFLAKLVKRSRFWARIRIVEWSFFRAMEKVFAQVRIVWILNFFVKNYREKSISGIDLNDLMELGSVVNGDEDAARKAHKLFRVIKDFQNYFMEMEKVLLKLKNLKWFQGWNNAIISVSQTCHRCHPRCLYWRCHQYDYFRRYSLLHRRCILLS